MVNHHVIIKHVIWQYSTFKQSRKTDVAKLPESNENSLKLIVTQTQAYNIR